MEPFGCGCTATWFGCYYFYPSQAFTAGLCTGQLCGSECGEPIGMGFSTADIVIKKNTIVKDGLTTISNLINIPQQLLIQNPIQCVKIPSRPTEESLKMVINNFSFVPLTQLKNLIDNLITSSNDFNTLSLPIFVKQQLDVLNTPTNIIRITQEVRNTIKTYIIGILADSVIGDEVKTYNYKQLFDLLFYYLAMNLRLQSSSMTQFTTQNIIKTEV